MGVIIRVFSGVLSRLRLSLARFRRKSRRSECAQLALKAVTFGIAVYMVWKGNDPAIIAFLLSILSWLVVFFDFDEESPLRMNSLRKRLTPKFICFLLSISANLGLIIGALVHLSIGIYHCQLAQALQAPQYMLISTIAISSLLVFDFLVFFEQTELLPPEP